MRTLGLLLASMAVACAHSPHGHSAHHRFENAEEWAPRFEDPSRDAWQLPEQVIAAFALPPNAKVADIGAATGYFAVRFAKALPAGQVYGVDIEPSMVRYLTERAQTEGLTNLTAVLGAADDPRLTTAVDLAIIVNTYHHIEARAAYLAKLKASLAPGGRIAIVDFKPSSSMGPMEKLAPEQVTAELVAAGFKPVATLDFLPEQYGLVFGI